MTGVKLSWDLMVWATLCGVTLCYIYCALLWYSVNKLIYLKHKGTFLFLSSLFRLTLFVLVAISWAIYHPILLLAMFMAFTATRFFIVKKKGAIC